MVKKLFIILMVLVPVIAIAQPTVIKQNGSKITKDNNAKLVGDVTIKIYEKPDGSIFYSFSSKRENVTDETPPWAPDVLARIGLALIDHSLPPLSRKDLNLKD